MPRCPATDRWPSTPDGISCIARRCNRSFVADSVVLDLGAGTGVHGLIAARLGAKRVYLVEPEDILAVAEEIVAANGLQETVRCLRGRLEDIQLPEPVDIIVSAVTGNFLLTEDLLPTLFHARDTALKPGGLLIPGAATMEATPVSAPTIHAQGDCRLVGVHRRHRSERRLGAYAANSVFYRLEELRDVEYLAEPRVLQTFDFSRDNYTSVHIDAVYEIARSGVCHGWVGWFSMKLGDRWVSTSPRDERSPLVARVSPSRSPCRVRARRAGFVHARSRPVRGLDLESSIRDRRSAAFDAAVGADGRRDAEEGRGRLRAVPQRRRPRSGRGPGPMRRLGQRQDYCAVVVRPISRTLFTRPPRLWRSCNESSNATHSKLPAHS